MNNKILACAIEEIAQLHPNLFCEDVIVSAVAIMKNTGKSPCCFTIECRNIELELADETGKIQLSISWQKETEEAAERMLQSHHRHRLVEDVAVGIAYLLAGRVLSLSPIIAGQIGNGSDYWVKNRNYMLEVSGTENPSELERRHKQKIKQLLSSRARPDGYVIVCCFTSRRIIFSFHQQEV